MDELEISGKRYISSKRIAKEHKYHSDYIGQLIRAGRVSGAKVGRAWYVDEESFSAYLGQERARTGFAQPPIEVPVMHEPAQQNSMVSEPAQNFSIGSSEPRESSVSASATEVVTSATVGTTTSSVEPEQNSVAEPATSESFAQAYIEPVHVEIKKEEYKVQIRKEEVFIPEPVVETKVESIKKPGLTYISDSSPLFPGVVARPKAISKPVVQQTQPRIEIQKEVPVVIRPVSDKKGSKLKTGIAVVSLMAFAAVVLAVVFFGSLDINSTVLVEQGKPASVAYSQNTTLCFIFGTCQSK